MDRFQFKVSPSHTYYNKSIKLECSGLRTICRQKELCCILLRQPSNLVDLLLDLKAFQVVKLRLMTLEGAVNIVLSSTLWLIFCLNNDRRDMRVKYYYSRNRFKLRSQDKVRNLSNVKNNDSTVCTQLV